MNIKIDNEAFTYLNHRVYEQYIFGSNMYGTVGEHSDTDVLCIYAPPSAWLEINYYPNNHMFQYDDVEDNTQYIFTTIDQFWRNQTSGDSAINTEILLFTDMIAEKNKLDYCRTYKVIKAFLGFAKRDMKDKNKNFHVNRCLYIAEELINNRLPELIHIKTLKGNEVDKGKEKELREKLNNMFNAGEIESYYIKPVRNELFQLLLNSNNIKEFKY